MYGERDGPGDVVVQTISTLLEIPPCHDEGETSVTHPWITVKEGGTGPTAVGVTSQTVPRRGGGLPVTVVHSYGKTSMDLLQVTLVEG